MLFDICHLLPTQLPSSMRASKRTMRSIARAVTHITEGARMRVQQHHMAHWLCAWCGFCVRIHHFSMLLTMKWALWPPHDSRPRQFIRVLLRNELAKIYKTNIWCVCNFACGVTKPMGPSIVICDIFLIVMWHYFGSDTYLGQLLQPQPQVTNILSHNYLS